MENEKKVDSEVIEEVPELKVVPEGEEDTIDWKAEAIKQQGIAKRFKTKLEKSKEAKVEAPVEKKVENKSNELDYAQKAYLKSSGINSEEFDFVKQVMQESGKDLDSVLESGYFKAELKSRRDAKALNDAMPKTPNRNGEPVSNQVEYWLKKGGLPPNTPENRKLRGEIVEARYQAAKASGNNPNF